MRRLSQKELLQEGIGSMIFGLARVARKAATGTAKALAPKTMEALGKGATLAAGAIENIRSGSPSVSIGTFLDSEDGKREFKGVKLGKETKLKNQNFKVEVKSGYYLNSLGGENIEEKDLTGGYYIVRRKNRGGGDGYDNEITEVYDGTGKRLNKNPIKIGTEVPVPAKAGKPDKTGKAAKAGKTGKAGKAGKPTKTAKAGKSAAKPAPETAKASKPASETATLEPAATPSAGARGKKGPRAAKSESLLATKKRIARAIKSERPPSKSDIEMLKKAGVKDKQKIGGVTFKNLKRRTKLAESRKSQKNLLKHLHYGSQMNK
jgi:hypothetical protein